ncbi:unnamed protein product [Allacma fusca]|uniref:G-protein coupled receptors family 1 profile domain-containing protein n=1 Tax=Allacma fusca TaxID=39272 RepID=A0A8J2PXN1_9HEXA|nr:unnamed protein product [Allacma fusca]
MSPLKTGTTNIRALRHALRTLAVTKMENKSIIYFEDSLEEEYIFADPGLQAVLIVLYTIVFFFCFFGNLTIVLVISLHWKMRGYTKFCMGNLAFANLCVGTFCVYQDLFMYLIDSWVFGDFLCKMYHFTNNLAHTASILILVVIAVERYLVILHPFRCRRGFTTRRLRLVILGVWILSALLCSPRLYYGKTVTNLLPGMKDERMRYEVICTLQLSIYDSSTATMTQFVLLFLLPLIIISILYTKIGVFLRQRETSFFVRAQTLTEGDSSGERTHLQKRESTRNFMFEKTTSLSRKVSFTERLIHRERMRFPEKTESCSLSVHARGCTCRPTCCLLSPSKKVNPCRKDSFGRGVLNREESTSSASSSSVVHSQLQRNSSARGAMSLANLHKGVVRMLGDSDSVCRCDLVILGKINYFLGGFILSQLRC